MNNLTGIKFKINQIISSKPPLCTGTIAKFLGTKDGLDYYESDITITWCVPKKEPKLLRGEIAVNRTQFYLSTENSPSNRMLNVSSQVEWE